MEFAAEQRDKDDVEGKFRNLNFSPSTKKTIEYSFELFLGIIDIRCFFFSSIKLQYCRTIVLLNKFKLLKKPLFQLSNDGHAISRQGKRWLVSGCPKAPCVFPPRKDGIILTRRVAWGLPSPSPRVCTGGRAYADVRTKISWIDRLPNVPIHGDPLCGFRPQRSSAIKQVLCFKFLYFCKCIACFSPQTLPVHLPTPLQCQKKNHM